LWKLTVCGKEFGTHPVASRHPSEEGNFVPRLNK
jgi:hypothetical protein